MTDLERPRAAGGPAGRRLPLPGELAWVLVFFVIDGAILIATSLLSSQPGAPTTGWGAALGAVGLGVRGALCALSAAVLLGGARRPGVRRLLLLFAVGTIGALGAESALLGASVPRSLELLLTVYGAMLLLLAPARRLFGETAPETGPVDAAEPPGIAAGDGGLRARGIARVLALPLVADGLLLLLFLPAVAVSDGFGRLLALAALATIVLALEPSVKAWAVRRLFDARPEGFEDWPEPAKLHWRHAVLAFRAGRFESAATAAREAARAADANAPLADFVLIARALEVRARLGRSRQSLLLTDTTGIVGPDATSPAQVSERPRPPAARADRPATDREDGAAEPDDLSASGTGSATAEAPPPPGADDSSATSSDELEGIEPVVEMEIPDGLGDAPGGAFAPEGSDDPERTHPEIALLLLTRAYPLAERRSSLTREVQSIRGHDLVRLVNFQVAVADALVRAMEATHSPFRLVAERLLEGVTGRTFLALAVARVRAYWERARRPRDLGRGFVLLGCRLIERDAEPLARIAVRRARREGVGAVPDDRAARELLCGLDAILEVYSFAEELRSGLTLDQARRRLEPLLWVVARDCGAFEYGTPLCGEVLKRSAEVRRYLENKERAVAAVLDLFEGFEDEVAYEASRVLRALRGPEDGPPPRGAAGWRAWWERVRGEGGLDRDLLCTVDGLRALGDGRPDAAKEAFEDAARSARQRRPFLFWNLAHAKSAAGDRDGALRACHDLLRRAPGGDARYRLLPARILESSGRTREAEIAYRRACRAGRGRDVAHYALGRFCYEHGRYDEALRQFWMARDADPNDPDYPMAIGLVHLRLGHHREARDVLEPLRGRSGVPQAGLFFLLSRAYTGLGDDAKAQELLQRVSRDERADPATLEEIAHFLEERSEFSLASDFAARALERRLEDDDEPGFGGFESDSEGHDEDDPDAEPEERGV